MKPRAFAPTILGAILAVGVALSAQGDFGSPRAAQAADQLKRTTERLADRALQGLLSSPNNSPSEIEDALLAQQVDSTATVLVEMIRNRRPRREVSEAARVIAALTRSAPSMSSQSALWRQVQNDLAAFQREVGGAGGPGGPGGPGLQSRPVVGRVAWRGVVDDRIQLVIKGRTIETRLVSGQPRPDGAATFTSPLPSSPVEVEVIKNAGRGSVTVLQHPARQNDFTAVIEISDDQAGAQEYRLDIFWR